MKVSVVRINTKEMLKRIGKGLYNNPGIDIKEKPVKTPPKKQKLTMKLLAQKFRTLQDQVLEMTFLVGKFQGNEARTEGIAKGHTRLTKEVADLDQRIDNVNDAIEQHTEWHKDNCRIENHKPVLSLGTFLLILGLIVATAVSVALYKDSPKPCHLCGVAILEKGEYIYKYDVKLTDDEGDVQNITQEDAPDVTITRYGTHVMGTCRTWKKVGYARKPMLTCKRCYDEWNAERRDMFISGTIYFNNCRTATIHKSTTTIQGKPIFPKRVD